MTIDAIPFELESSASDAWSFSGGVLKGVAPAQTDLFNDPSKDTRLASAPMLLFPVSGDFLFSAEVTVAFEGTFDAGVLVLWQDEDHWAKLCFEFSPAREPMVVSVVTNGRSDDANCKVMSSNTVFLRVAKRGRSFAFHYSIDGSYWHMVRHFPLPGAELKAGFLVQAPRGEGVSAEFRKIAFTRATLPELRTGE